MCISIGSIADYYPEALWQSCIMHFYRNVFSVVSKGKVAEIATMLKAIHVCEDRKSALQKTEVFSNKLEQMTLPKTIDKVRSVIQETLTQLLMVEDPH